MVVLPLPNKFGAVVRLVGAMAIALIPFSGQGGRLRKPDEDNNKSVESSRVGDCRLIGGAMKWKSIKDKKTIGDVPENINFSFFPARAHLVLKC